MSDDSPSVSTWISELKRGNSVAAQKLWNVYFERLLAVARAKLKGRPRSVEDEEDAVLDAMNSVFGRARGGKFPDLHDRSDLWALLVTVTVRKTQNQVAKERAAKRGGGHVKPFSEMGCDLDWFDQALAEEPDDALAGDLLESFRELLRLLDGELRLIAQRKLEGCSNREIARELQVDSRTVDRKMCLIRLRCEELLEAGEDSR